ncbi:MAG: AAA family ATPase, partial [Campylobacter sp.]|nr:AAA family ATPase [Campylobacter sp.]
MATQLNNVTGIKLQGNNFNTETKLQLFVNKNQLSRVSIIYGKNGSGKSTIATAFNKIKGDNIQDITTAELIYKDNNVISLNNDDKNNIFVFDETYILNQIRIEEDGLDTIVMLGDMVDIEKQLKDEENKKIELENEKKEQENKCNDLNDDRNENSPNYWFKKMMSNLKGQDNQGNKNWAERDFEIKQIAGENPRRATSVSDDKYKDFINLSPTKSRDDLITKFNQLLEELKTAQSGTKTIITEVKSDYSFDFDENKFIDLLSKKIEQPNLSERECFLIYIMKEKQEQHLHEIKDFFAKNENDRCPFCTQAVSSVHKQELFASIEKILSKASEEHKQELQSYKREEITINFDGFAVLDKTTIEECSTALTQFNDCVKIINNKIEEKSGNVYQPVMLEHAGIQNKFDNLISKLKQLEELRLKYNEETADTNSIKNKLNAINNDIAYYDICNEYKKFQETTTLKKQADEKLENDIKKLEECEETIEKLTADKEKVEIAVEEINQGLQYIFFAKNRLEIEYRDKKYCLKSMGNTVKPNKISTGERNAIAMCYFFSQTMQNKEKDDYSSPYLLVIDDPVSSFDMENRIGLLSFLRHKLKQYLCGNENTKV